MSHSFPWGALGVLLGRSSQVLIIVAGIDHHFQHFLGQDNRVWLNSETHVEKSNQTLSHSSFIFMTRPNLKKRIKISCKKKSKILGLTSLGIKC